jgi:hypothetical protein
MGVPSLEFQKQMNDATPPRNMTELFLGFLSIGARSFGGVMPLASGYAKTKAVFAGI